MNLAFNYCWKEWRAQRSQLIAYTLLEFSCLSLAMYLARDHHMFHDGHGFYAVSWFVAAGVIGVAVFVVPSLVRSEFTNKEDQLVRRLPDALWASFVGKLLFLAFASLLLPLMGLLFGEVLATSLDRGWQGLCSWSWDQAACQKQSVMVAAWSGFALLLLPWIWAACTWTPGGRLGLLTAALLMLVVSVAVFAVDRQSPGIFERVVWQSWLWTVPVGGLVVVAASWCKGRRGGGALRSARVGLLATAVTLLPGAAWILQRAWFYHHPRDSRIEQVHVWGMSPDERFVLANVSEDEHWRPVPVRIDLHDGALDRIGGTESSFVPGVEPPFLAGGQRQRRRFWRESSNEEVCDVLDITTGVREVLDYDKQRRLALLSEELRDAVRADCIANTRFRAPDGLRVWLENGMVCKELLSGSVHKQAWDIGDGRFVQAAGLGLKRLGSDQLFDLVGGRAIKVPAVAEEHFVGQSLVFRNQSWDRTAWRTRSAEYPDEPRDALRGADVLGLLDDTRLLVCRGSMRQSSTPMRMFLFAPDSGAVTEIKLPPGWLFDGAQSAEPMGLGGSLLARDPKGCVWLRCVSFGHVRECFARLDPDTLQVCPVLPQWRYVPDRVMQLLSFRELPHVVVQDGMEIVRIHIDTGERTVLFPRQPSSSR